MCVVMCRLKCSQVNPWKNCKNLHKLLVALDRSRQSCLIVHPPN